MLSVKGVDSAKTYTMLIVYWNMRRRTKMTVIEDLQQASEDIINLTLDYSAKKLLLKEKEAKLMLETDFEEVLGKKRPTVDEKKSYITLNTLKDKEALDKSTAEMEKAKRTYEIRKLECKMTGNFLNTIAGVCEDDD
jgi:hypothetical protein